MSKKPIFAILATAFALASVAEATALDDRNSAARAKSRTSAAATSPKKKAGTHRRPASENYEYLPVQRHS